MGNYNKLTDRPATEQSDENGVNQMIGWSIGQRRPIDDYGARFHGNCCTGRVLCKTLLRRGELARYRVLARVLLSRIRLCSGVLLDCVGVIYEISSQMVKIPLY